MAGKARSKQGFGVKLSAQQETNKTLHNLSNQGIIQGASNISIVTGGTIGGGTVNTFAKSDLQMNTYDICDVDRLKFAVKEGAGDVLNTTTDYGMEAIYTGSAAYGLKIQMPDGASDIFQIVRGTTEEINISTLGTIIGSKLWINDDIQMPYLASTTSHTSGTTTLDSTFGDTNGCMGIQYDSTASAGSGKYRLWIRANGGWYKTEAS